MAPVQAAERHEKAAFDRRSGQIQRELGVQGAAIHP